MYIKLIDDNLIYSISKSGVGFYKDMHDNMVSIFLIVLMNGANFTVSFSGCIFLIDNQEFSTTLEEFLLTFHNDACFCNIKAHILPLYILISIVIND